MQEVFSILCHKSTMSYVLLAKSTLSVTSNTREIYVNNIYYYNANSD